jgi:hypothetical protein
MRFEIRSHIYVEGLLLPEDLRLGNVVMAANPEGHTPHHASIVYEEANEWRDQADRDLMAAVAVLGMKWVITAPYRIVSGTQVFPDGRRVPLVFFSEPFGGRPVEEVRDDGQGDELARLIASADAEILQIVNWYLWGLQTEQVAGDGRLAVIPYAMVLDGLSKGNGKTVTRWRRLLKWLADGGDDVDVTASQLFRARNSWVKEQSFGNNPGSVTIAHFRRTAYFALLRVLNGETPPNS